MCENFADGFVARIQVKLSLTLLIAGVFGFVFECLNAFEYLQGTRLALIGYQGTLEPWYQAGYLLGQDFTLGLQSPHRRCPPPH